MKIAILGAGSIGTLIAGKLIQSSLAEVLLHCRGDHAAKLAIDGIIVKGVEDFTIEPDKFHLSIQDIKVNHLFDGSADYIFICSKANDVDDMMIIARRMSKPSTRVLTLSNGLGHLENNIKMFGPERVVASTITHGAWKQEPGIIHWAGIGSFNLGGINSGPSEIDLSELTTILQKCNLNPTWSPDGYSMIWSKVLLNIAINPIAAITGLSNGGLLRAEIFQTCVEVMLEGARIARQEGVAIDCDEKLINNLRSVLNATSKNHCSMLQDVRKGKSTEIKYLNQELVERAEKYGIYSPFNQLLTKLIQFITLY